MSGIESSSEKEKQSQNPKTPDTLNFSKKTGNREHKKFLKEYKIETSPYEAYKMLPHFKQKFIELQRNYSNYYSPNNKEKKDYSDKNTIIEINPSDASVCLRKVGYRLLGEKPLERTVDQQWRTWIGTQLHKGEEYIMRRRTDQDSNRAASEFPLEVLLDGGIKLICSTDSLLKNPKIIGQWQVIDYKNIVWYPRIKSNRDEEYKGTKGIYQPELEHELQVLLYLYIANHEQNRINATMGNVVYVEVSKFPTKECPIVFNEKNRQKVKNFVEKIKVAAQDIREGKPPEPTVVNRKKWCRADGMCEFRHICTFAKNPKWVEQKNFRRRMLTPQQKVIIAKERAKKKEIADKLGVTQPNLPGLEPNSPPTP